MLFVKRFFTALVLFLPIAVVLFFLVLIVGGAIVGGMAGMENPDDPAAAGEAAGQAFGEAYAVLIFFGSLALSFVISVLMGFTGLFPWCRKPAPPRIL